MVTLARVGLVLTTAMVLRRSVEKRPGIVSLWFGRNGSAGVVELSIRTAELPGG